MQEPIPSHSGDEPKPQGAFKTLEYAKDATAPAVTTMPAPTVTTTPASKAAVAMAAGEPVKGGTAPSTDLDEMTNADLHQRAADLNIEGRSQLTTKDDLVKAIKSAERKSAKP